MTLSSFRYAIIWNKGYQTFTNVESSVTTKVKGVLTTKNIPDNQFNKLIADKDLYRKVWDLSDLVVPPTVT